MRLRIQPYRPGSRSARALADETGILRLRLVRTRFRPRPDDTIINWGSHELLFDQEHYLNEPRRVVVAADKLASIRCMDKAGVSVPDFTTDPSEAQDWVDEGDIVVARTLLNASSGRGIVLCGREYGDDVPEAPLYTAYVPKYDEYRIHVWQGQVIDRQQKRRRNGYEGIDSRVRNASGGWVFCRENIEVPSAVDEEAVKAVEALRLDFGAADVGFTRNRNLATVYEVNTAPGLEGATVVSYAAAIRRYSEAA